MYRQHFSSSAITLCEKSVMVVSWRSIPWSCWDTSWTHSFLVAFRKYPDSKFLYELKRIETANYGFVTLAHLLSQFLGSSLGPLSFKKVFRRQSSKAEGQLKRGFGYHFQTWRTLLSSYFSGSVAIVHKTNSSSYTGSVLASTTYVMQKRSRTHLTRKTAIFEEFLRTHTHNTTPSPEKQALLNDILDVNNN